MMSDMGTTGEANMFSLIYGTRRVRKVYGIIAEPEGERAQFAVVV
jgi:hypothetical protein